MNWTTALQLSLRALARNKTRAMLTALGVVIGVGSVIAMLGIGSGAQQRIAEQLASMGTNNLVVRPGSVTRGGVRTGAGGITTLTRADADAIAELVDVLAVAPSVKVGSPKPVDLPLSMLPSLSRRFELPVGSVAPA